MKTRTLVLIIAQMFLALQGFTSSVHYNFHIINLDLDFSPGNKRYLKSLFMTINRLLNSESFYKSQEKQALKQPIES